MSAVFRIEVDQSFSSRTLDDQIAGWNRLSTVVDTHSVRAQRAVRAEDSLEREVRDTTAALNAETKAEESNAKAKSRTTSTTRAASSAAGGYKNAIRQAAFGVEDFVVVLRGGGGLDRALLSVTNNVVAASAGFGPLGIAAVTAGSLIAGKLIPELIGTSDAADKAASSVERLSDRIKSGVETDLIVRELNEIRDKLNAGTLTVEESEVEKAKSTLQGYRDALEEVNVTLGNLRRRQDEIEGRLPGVDSTVAAQLKEELSEIGALFTETRARQTELNQRIAQQTGIVGDLTTAFEEQQAKQAELKQIEKERAEQAATEEGLRKVRVEAEAKDAERLLRRQQDAFDDLLREKQITEDRWLELTRNRIDEQLKLELASVDGVVEAERLRLRAVSSIRDAEHQAELARTQRELDAVKEKAQSELQAEKAKLDAIKGLISDGEGGGIFGQATQFSEEQIVREVQRFRGNRARQQSIQAGRVSSADLREAELAERRRTAAEARTGQLDERAVQAAQERLTRGVVEQARQSNSLGQRHLRALESVSEIQLQTARADAQRDAAVEAIQRQLDAIAGAQRRRRRRGGGGGRGR